MNSNDCPPVSRLTKEVVAKCQNEELVSYLGLKKFKPNVAAAIAAHPEYRQRYVATETELLWLNVLGSPINSTKLDDFGVYRLRPDTPIHRQWVDCTIITRNASGILSVVATPSGRSCYVSSCLANPDCIGIWYELNGEMTLRKEMSLSYGKIVGVRFEID